MIPYSTGKGDCIPEASSTPLYLSIIGHPSPDLSKQDHNFESCPSCGSNRLNTVQMPSGCKHHAAIRCAGCDRFLKWTQSPGNKEKRQQREAAISQLLQSPKLTDWEKGFLESVQNKGKLSPKQSETLSRIEMKVGGQC